MKRFFSIIYIFTIVILSSAHVFPDRLPDWKELNSYSPVKFEFQKTGLKEFKALCPGVEPYDIGNGIVIYTVKPENTNSFKEINVGFRNEILDWIEFALNQQVEADEFTALYGFPKYIDTKYSDTLDYYNYDNFSASVDKKYFFVRSISIFTQNEPTVKNNLRTKISESGEMKFFEVYPGLKPGVTTERDFAQKHPDLLPYMEGDFDTNATYTLVEELQGAENHYQKAVLRFEHGILAWINLIPTYEKATNMLDKFGKPNHIEKLDDYYDFYIYDNFIFTVHKEQKRVNTIGLIEFDNRF